VTTSSSTGSSLQDAVGWTEPTQPTTAERDRVSHVLVVTNAWPPMAAGTGRTLRGMLGRRPHTTVLAPRGSEPGTAGGAVVKATLRFAGRAGGPFKLHSALQHLEVVLAPIVWCLTQRHQRPTVIICVQPLFSGVGGLLTKWLFRVPYVVLLHGEELTTMLQSSLPFRIRRQLLRTTLDHASALVCNAQHTRRLALEAYGIPSGRVHVIHPSVDSEHRPGWSREALATLRDELAGRDGSVVLMAGRLAEAHKGFDVAVEALPEISRRHPKVRLVIAGPGDQAPLRRLAEHLNVLEQVEFLGYVPPDRLSALFAVCDLFLLPGREVEGSAEGFGVVFLEAGLAGKPVVAGRAGGAPEAVLDGETGLVVDGQSPSAVAAAVDRLLADPALAARLGDNGRARVRREFDGRQQHDQLAAVLRTALSKAAV
jgi:phosphatidyl-myo-inositol dimannoside synthase